MTKMKKKIEELGDQRSPDEALKKMRNGIILRLVESYHNNLFEIRNTKGPDGQVTEYVYEFKNTEGYPLSDVYTTSSWLYYYTEYIDMAGLTMNSREAIEALKRGRGVHSTRHQYFVAKLQGPGVPASLVEQKLVFWSDRESISTQQLYVQGSVDELALPDNISYGYVD